jgi:hypothetical protein
LCYVAIVYEPSINFSSFFHTPTHKHTIFMSQFECRLLKKIVSFLLRRDHLITTSRQVPKATYVMATKYPNAHATSTTTSTSTVSDLFVQHKTFFHHHVRFVVKRRQQRRRCSIKIKVVFISRDFLLFILINLLSYNLASMPTCWNEQLLLFIKINIFLFNFMNHIWLHSHRY